MAAVNTSNEDFSKKEGVVTEVTPREDVEAGQTGHLKRDLKNRHMQMIAIGGAIGAGLFVGSGGALQRGGPASLVICYMIVGVMLLITTLALAEMAVLYPINGAFFTYTCRFVDESWGFAIGWEYALGWLTVLPFELIAATVTIQFWRDDIHMAVWVTVFIVALVIIQFFGVRGYGEVEFVLSAIKICACMGFMIWGIIYNCGGVGDKGYIGGKYWSNPGAFTDFRGFCSVFVTAAFAFGGTEMVGLASAETANPRKSIPRASKQVFWRICLFYVVNLLIVGLCLPYDDKRLADASGANTKASPFVLAIKDAGVKVLPSIFNAVITISVLSVANSCTFGSSRTIQAMAERQMAPKFFSYIDGKGRPLYCIALQLGFGLLAYIGEAPSGSTIFSWLLALTGLSFVIVWATICWTHIRMYAGFKAQGVNVNLIPYRTPLGVTGSYIGLFLNILTLILTLYSAVQPAGGGKPTAEAFFNSYMAAPIALFLWLGHKVCTGNWRLTIPAHEMDLHTGAVFLAEEDEVVEDPKTWANLPMRIVRCLV